MLFYLPSEGALSFSISSIVAGIMLCLATLYFKRLQILFFEICRHSQVYLELILKTEIQQFG